MIFCPVNTYFPVFYYTLLFIKIKKLTYVAFIKSAIVLHIS